MKTLFTSPHRSDSFQSRLIFSW